MGLAATATAAEVFSDTLGGGGGAFVVLVDAFGGGGGGAPVDEEAFGGGGGGALADDAFGGGGAGASPLAATGEEEIAVAAVFSVTVKISSAVYLSSIFLV